MHLDHTVIDTARLGKRPSTASAIDAARLGHTATDAARLDHTAIDAHGSITRPLLGHTAIDAARGKHTAIDAARLDHTETLLDMTAVSWPSVTPDGGVDEALIN
jgi:hypothetical protein